MKGDIEKIWKFAREEVGFHGKIYIDHPSGGEDLYDRYDSGRRAIYLSQRWAETGKYKTGTDFAYHFLHELAHADQHLRNVHAPLWARRPSKRKIRYHALRAERDASRRAVRWAAQLGINIGIWGREVLAGGDRAYPAQAAYVQYKIKKGRAPRSKSTAR